VDREVRNAISDGEACHRSDTTRARPGKQTRV
jgi:hypothetical protein